MKSTLKTIFATGVFLSLAMLLGCQTTDPQPTTPIFSGTKEISLTSPLHTASLGGGSFFYSVPTEVKYVVFGVFNAQIVTNGSTISNEANFLYGSRTGLSDFVAGTQVKSTLHDYDSSTKNFKTPNSTVPAGTYYWAVWGYDQYGNLTHSSPQRQVGL
jgi:hypothetical protein